MLDSFSKWGSSPRIQGLVLTATRDRVLLSSTRPKVMLVGVDMRPGMHMGTTLQ